MNDPMNRILRAKAAAKLRYGRDLAAAIGGECGDSLSAALDLAPTEVADAGRNIAAGRKLAANLDKAASKEASKASKAATPATDKATDKASKATPAT